MLYVDLTCFRPLYFILGRSIFNHQTNHFDYFPSAALSFSLVHLVEDPGIFGAVLIQDLDDFLLLADLVVMLCNRLLIFLPLSLLPEPFQVVGILAIWNILDLLSSRVELALQFFVQTLYVLHVIIRPLCRLPSHCVLYREALGAAVCVSW